MPINNDIQLENEDPLIMNGDFVSGPSDQQHIEDTIDAFPGWWKQFPTEGVGVRAWIGGPADTQALVSSIRLNLQNDGYKVNNPSAVFDSHGELIIDPGVKP